MDRKPRRITTSPRTVMSDKGANIRGYAFSGPYPIAEILEKPGIFAVGYDSPLGSSQWSLVDVRCAENIRERIDQEMATQSDRWLCWKKSCKGEEGRISFLVHYLDAPMPELEQMVATILTRYVPLPCSSVA